VIHKDTLLLNMLWSEELQHVVFVDIELAEVQTEERPPLCLYMRAIPYPAINGAKFLAL
jgi:hypothetical protein